MADIDIAAASASQDRITPDELRFERLLPAPIETVWAYFTDPGLRALWFMGGATGSAPGEKIGMVMDHRNLSDGDVATPERFADHIGKSWDETILEIDAPRLLSFTWSGGAAGTVRVELSPEGAGTRLVLTHSRLRGRSDAINFGAGWTSHLDVLRKRIGGERVENFWAIHAAVEARLLEQVPA